TAWINVELKAERWGDTGVAEAAGTLLEAGGHSDHVVVSSFHPLCLLRLALRFPGLRRALLLDPDRPMALQTGLFLPLLARDAVHPEAGHFDRVDVDRWHRGGREVAAWTIDDPAVARRVPGRGGGGGQLRRQPAGAAALRPGRGVTRAVRRPPPASRGRVPGRRRPGGGGG